MYKFNVFKSIAVGLGLTLISATLVAAEPDPALKDIDRAIRMRDYTQAIELMSPLLKDGSAEAQYRMAAMYRYGRGVRKELDQALELYRKAAQQGHADSQYTLASLLAKQGHTAEADVWMLRASEQGHSKAQKLIEQASAGDLAVDQDVVFSAILHNKKEQIRDLVAAKYDFNFTDDASRTPLLSALIAERSEIAEALLPVTSNLAQRDQSGQQALHVAATHGYFPVINGLLARGVNVNAQDGLGNTPLTMAVRHDDLKLVDLLVKAGADPNLKNRSGKSPLDIANARGDAKIMAAFEKRGLAVGKQSLAGGEVSVDAFQKSVASSSNLYEGWPLLSIAALLGEQAIVDQLIRDGASVNEADDKGFTALHRAAGKGNLKSVDFLVAAGAVVNAQNNNQETPLYLAARSGHADVTKALLVAGADSALITTNKDSALRAAILNGNAEVARLLADKPLDAESLYAALIAAVQTGDDDLGVVLSRRDIDFSRQDKKERNLLWHAVDAGLLKLVTVISQRGDGDIMNQQDVNGYSPLARAVALGRQPMAMLLVARKADPNVKTREKNTLVMLAVLANKQSLASFLLDKGVDIDAQNNAGDTALIMAAAHGDKNMVDMLIKRGADVQVRNRDDLNAYMVALNAGHGETAQFIRDNSGELFKIFN